MYRKIIGKMLIFCMPSCDPFNLHGLIGEFLWPYSVNFIIMKMHN